VPWVLHLMDKQPEFIFGNIPTLVRPLFGRVSGETLRRTNVIAMSEHLLDEIAQDTGITFDNEVDIVPGWVNTEGLSLRTEYLQDGVARFVTAGAVVPHKGIGLIVDAAAALVALGVENFTIDVYGEGQIALFVEQASALGVQSKIRFLGGRSQTQLLAAYPTYDAFLFPTWEREPFGFAPIEAAACGCVPIMTRNCGASERVLDRVHCIKIERDVDELTDAMLEVIEGRVDLAALGRAGSQLVHSDLSLEKMIGQIERALERAATGWDTKRAGDPRLSLLFHVKQDLALAMARGYPH
jgi:glycosyltransferase involved in cell wall biosynthesis